MNIISIYKNIKKRNNVYLFNYKKNSFFQGIYRFFAIILSPLMINISPNIISVLALSFGIIGLLLFLYFNLDLNIIIIFFFLSFIFDFTDGLIARYQKSTSFYGRFIDGLFDILVIGLLKIILISYILNSDQNYFVNYYYYLVLFLHPIQHLILDRFSALARWCNEINSSYKIKPYYRDKAFTKITLLFHDLQHFCIFLILFKNFFEINIILEFYFFLSLLASIFSILLYIHLGKKNFTKISNQFDNKEGE